MARSLSAAAFREMFAQESADAFLVCLTLTLDPTDGGQTVRVVYNNQPVVRTAGTFQPALFSITLPEETPDQIPEIQLSIDNVDKSISNLLAGLYGRQRRCRCFHNFFNRCRFFPVIATAIMDVTFKS